MNITDSTPLTDLSETTQANNKYKKALKQINRLISINTSVKKELIAVQEGFDALRTKYNNLQEKYQLLQEEVQNEAANRALQGMGKVALSCQEPINSSNQFSEDSKFGLGLSQKKQKDSSPLSIRAKQLQNTGTLSEYMDTKRKLEKVEQKLFEKQKQIDRMSRQLEEKCKQNADLYEKYIEASNNLNKAQNELQLNKKDDLSKSIQTLKNELSKYKEMTSKIIKENESLKSIANQSPTQPTVPKPKGFEAFSVNQPKSPLFLFKGRPPAVPYHQSFYSSAQHSLQSSAQKEMTDPFSEYYFKKVRDLELQIKKLKKQYSDKKSNYKTQIANLKQHLQTKEQHIKQITNFIVKQQAFIQSFYQKNENNFQPMPKMVSSFAQYEKTCNMPNFVRAPGQI